MRLAALLFVLAACHHDPQPMHPQPGDLPPLPPASGTPIGYLLDARTDLALTPDQVTKLTKIDNSLAARDAEIDQLERADELALEEVAAAAVIAEAGERVEEVGAAGHGAVAGFHAPDRHQDGGIDAVPGFQTPQAVVMFAVIGLPSRDK